MSKKNKKANNQQIINVAYQSIFEIVEDETGHASYRRYFDKVLKDLFGLEDAITSFLMSTNQFKYLKKLMNDPDSKPFIQMLLKDEDIKTLYDLVRVAYDSMQIYNKPKKNVTSKDIKAYRYLTKLYSQGIKTLKKKYKVEDIGKKEYKHKYSELDRFLGGKASYKTPYYNLDYLDDNDEDFGDLYEDDDDEEDDQFDPNSDFDLSDLPPKFVIGENPHKSHKKSSLILDGDDDDISLYDDSEDDEDEDSDEDVMPQKEFQKYAMSIFEKLLDKLETDDMSRFNTNDVSNGIEPNWTPIDSEDAAKMNCENLKHLKTNAEPDPSTTAPHVYDLSGNLVYIDELPWLSTYDEVVNAKPNLIFKCLHSDDTWRPYYKDENGLCHPFNSNTGKIVMDTTIPFIKVANKEEEKSDNSEPEKPKSYKEMTSEEIINEFNSSNAAQLAEPAKGTEAIEKIEYTGKLEGELTQ